MFAREMAVPAAFALAGLTLAVLAKDLLGYTDLIINRGLGFGSVALIALHRSIPLAAAMLPFAVLVGCLSGLARLGANRELLALETAGLSPLALASPVLRFVTVVSVLAFGLSLLVAPSSERSLAASLLDLARSHPATAIQAGGVQRFGDWKLEVREASARGERLRGVLLWAPEIGRTVFAERGALSVDPDGSTRITLENASVLLDPQRTARQMSFESLTTRLPDMDQPVLSDAESEFSGTPLGDLLALARGEAGADARIQRAQVELQRRMALPTATVLFGLLALPIALQLPRFSRSAGGLAGILVAIAYYGLVQLGNGLIEGHTVGVALGVWLPNLVVAALMPFLWVGVVRRPSFGLEAGDRVRRWRFRRASDASPGQPQERRPRVRRFALRRYVAMRFIELAASAFLFLLVGYLLVDVLERLDFFALYPSTAGQLGRYYAGRIPLLTSRIVPMALLMAAALTASLLADQNELIGMRACGLVPRRVLSVILWLCALIAPLSFLLSDQIVPRASAFSRYVKEVEIKGGGVEPGASPAWYRMGDRVYEVALLDVGSGTAQNLRIYELGDDGLPVGVTEAKRATYVQNGVWRVWDATRVEVSNGRLRSTPAPAFVELDQEPPADISIRRMSVGKLRELIRDAAEAGFDATSYRVDLYASLAAPFACVVLPALALLFATSGPPYPNPAATLLFGFLVAVGYVLLTGLSASLGYGHYLPAPVAGMAPEGLLGLSVVYLALRERGFR